MIAAALGNVSVFRYLVKHGAIVNDVDYCSRSVLMYACGAPLRNDSRHSRDMYPGGDASTRLEDYAAMVRLLCARVFNLNACDNEGKTAFMYAARHFNLETLRTLIEHGVDVKYRANIKGQSCYRQDALSYATRGGIMHTFNRQQVECIEFLKSLGL